MARANTKSALEYRVGRNQVEVSAQFIHESARYTLQTVVFADPFRVGPITQRVSCKAGTIFESMTSVGAHSVRTDTTFGSATTGTRKLSVTAKPFSEGLLIGGRADGAELVSTVIPNCSCRDETRPLLTWNADGSASPVHVDLKPHDSLADLAGLEGAAQTAIARANDGRFGQHHGALQGCFDSGECVVACTVAVFQCFGWVLGGVARKRMILHCPLYVGVCILDCLIGHHPT
jgi:hypothetical protein